MRIATRILFVLVVLSTFASAQQAQTTQGRDPNTGLAFTIKPSTQPAPREWIDKDTGHRVVRLSDEPNSASLYFHQYAFSPDGRRLVFTSPTGIYQVDLQTRKIELILAAQTTLGKIKVLNSIIQVGQKSGHVFFTRRPVAPASTQRSSAAAATQPAPGERSIWWIDPVTKEEHEIGTLPANVSIGSVNCDETLLAGAITYLDGRGGAPTTQVSAGPGQRIDILARWAQHLPMALVIMDAKTGEVKTMTPGTDWLDHCQFSTVDPNLLMFCTQGPWQNVEPTWTIHTDGSKLTKIHSRTMINEIWGHQFWSADGSAIWYQLYTPVSGGGVDWIAGTNIKTHGQIWYQLDSALLSVHVNIAPNGRYFAGDGGANAQSIMLHTPHLTANTAAPGAYDTAGLIQPGTLDTERLVNLSNHQYALEPNVVFTPDSKWVVFRSNIFGPSYVFEVEVAKSR